MTSNLFWKPLMVAPAVLGALVVSTVAVTVGAAEASNAGSNQSGTSSVDAQVEAIQLQSGSAIVADASIAAPADSATSTDSLAQISMYGAEEQRDALDQVTSVSQLTDVRPTDWAFQALQSLVERYGCIVGYPNRTYRGNQALTRYEFAAGLNACLDRVNELIAAGTADLVKKEDLLALQKLQEEFAAELATLRGRVDALEARTSTLERQQFSTTTKLSGEVIFAISDTFGDRATRNGSGGFLPGVNAGNEDNFGDETETIFTDRVRLSLDTSFTGSDRLRTRLSGSNTTPFAGAFTGTNMTRLSFDGLPGGTPAQNNQVFVDKLYYRFALGSNLRVQVDAINNEFYDGLVSSLSPFESSGLGSISRFGRFNPIYRSGSPSNTGSAGLTFAYRFGDALRLEGGVVTDRNSNDPTRKNGLFDGDITYIGQLVFTPNPALTVGLTYANSYYTGTPGGGAPNLTGSTGSAFAVSPFGGAATKVDSFAGSLQFRLSPQFLVGGWFGAQFADQQTGGDNDATILNGAVYLAFPDLGKKGNLAGILVGVPPKVTDNDIAGREDDDTTLHVEGFYRYRITDNIAITPGVIVLFNPEHNGNNDTQFVGTLRTTFTF